MHSLQIEGAKLSRLDYATKKTRVLIECIRLDFKELNNLVAPRIQY